MEYFSTVWTTIQPALLYAVTRTNLNERSQAQRPTELAPAGAQGCSGAVQRSVRTLGGARVCGGLEVNVLPLIVAVVI